MFHMELSDFSGSHWVTVFEEKATKLLGKTAAELGDLLESNRVSNAIFSFFFLFEFPVHSKLENSLFSEIKS